jgi:branched-chain amino acid transport system permease protein
MKNAVGWAAALIALSAVGFTMSSYHLELYQKLLLVATLAVGFNFLFGVSGQIAFSHISFYGIGGYAMVILTFKLGLPLAVGIAGGIVISALLAALVAIPTTRLEGFYLALVTLAFAQLFLVALGAGGELTGEEEGISGYGLPSFFDIPLTGAAYTPIIVFVLLLTLWVILRLDNSYFGRACRAVRDNPVAASAMGIDVARTKVTVFVVTSTLAAIAGMAYAFVNNFISPPIFELDRIFELLFMIIIGGTGRYAGALLGAALLYSIQFLVEPLVGRFHPLIYGFVVVLVILFLPKGLIGVWDDIVARRNRRLVRASGR